MLDAHKDVRCGEETRVVPRLLQVFLAKPLKLWIDPFLQMRSHWMKSQKESLRLEEAGLTGDVLDSAISSFILEVSTFFSINCGWNSPVYTCDVTPNFLFWEWTIDARNKFYTWSHLKIFLFASVISVYICPKSDISGALGPIHYITLKAFAMALGDGTKYKTYFGCPRMVLCGPWKELFFSKIEGLAKHHTW